MIGTYLASLGFVFGVSYCNIFLRAFQQRNVAFLHYLAVIPTSVCMGYAEVYIFNQVAQQGFSHGIALALGLGGGTGCVTSMYLHHKFLTRK